MMVGKRDYDGFIDRPARDLDGEQLSALHEAFRAGPPLTPDQQVGRGPTIDGLAERLGRGEIKKMYEGRRVGKTSVARSALRRIREEGGVDAEVNLAIYSQPAEVASRLAAQLAAGLSAPAATRSLLQRVSDAVAPAHNELGHDAGAILDVTERLLGDARSPARVLLNAAGHAKRRLAVFLDEAHVIATWPEPEQEALGAALRDVSKLGVVIASSERRAFELLSGDGGPLQYVGDRFVLPPIADADWRAEVPRRFARLGAPIVPAALDYLLEESTGQPYCTMLLARESAAAAIVAGQCSEVHVQAGLLVARKDEAWQDLI